MGGKFLSHVFFNVKEKLTTPRGPIVDKAKALGDTVILDLDYYTDSVLEKNGLLRHTEIWADTTNTEGVLDDYTYNDFGEVKGYIAQSSLDDGVTTSPNLDVSYDRDKLGRIIEKTESVSGAATKVTQYDYNLAGYLITVTDITNQPGQPRGPEFLHLRSQR